MLHTPPRDRIKPPATNPAPRVPPCKDLLCNILCECLCLCLCHCAPLQRLVMQCSLFMSMFVYAFCHYLTVPPCKGFLEDPNLKACILFGLVQSSFVFIFVFICLSVCLLYSHLKKCSLGSTKREVAAGHAHRAPVVCGEHLGAHCLERLKFCSF